MIDPRSPRDWRHAARVASIALAIGLYGCAEPSHSPSPTPPTAETVAAVPPAPAASVPAPAAVAAPAAPLPILPFDEAVASAASGLLEQAALPATGARPSLVVDPLIDGVTGAQTAATQTVGTKLGELIRSRYPQFDFQPFTAATLSKSPLVLIGTFTGVNADRKTEGLRESYRICLALADLKTGRLVAKGLAFATKDGVDPTPTAFYRDAPGLIEDAATTGYVRSCQGTRAGDPIHPAYIEAIRSAGHMAEAHEAYTAGRYTDALKLYATAEGTAARHLRLLNGVYLANWRLGRASAAAQAFGELVDHGLESRRLGIKFLFRPGSTVLYSDPGGPTVPYAMWLREIGTRAGKAQSCLEVVGHASLGGPDPVNERLARGRAERIRNELIRVSKPLAGRLTASGAGSRETLVGNARDDASDALDRRVEFKVVGC